MAKYTDQVLELIELIKFPYKEFHIKALCCRGNSETPLYGLSTNTYSLIEVGISGVTHRST